MQGRQAERAGDPQAEINRLRLALAKAIAERDALQDRGVAPTAPSSHTPQPVVEDNATAPILEPPAATGPAHRIHLDYGAFESAWMEQPNLQDQALFVVGAARSGTTPLQICLNASRDVFLMGEAHLHLWFWRPDFIDFYNATHRAHGNARTKGTFAPYLGASAASPFGLLSHLARNYRYVGDKIAFGPRSAYWDLSPQENFFQFHQRFFLRSNYVFIFRRPDEIIASYAKRFPSIPPAEILEVWLLTLDIFCDVLRTFENVYTIMFDRLHSGTINALASRLGLDLRGADVHLDVSQQQTRARDLTIPEHLRQHVDRAMVLFDEMYQVFDPETLTLHSRASDELFGNSWKAAVAESLAALREAGGESSDRDG